MKRRFGFRRYVLELVLASFLIYYVVEKRVGKLKGTLVDKCCYFVYVRFRVMKESYFGFVEVL